jgi:mannose-1-phosphate guanylyltransferase
LVTLGIKPTKASTGYGYIQYDEENAEGGFYKVKTFTEKPDLEIAQTFLKSGDFLVEFRHVCLEDERIF